MKSEIRKLNREKRNSLSKTEVQIKSKKASDYFTESKIYKNAETIMLYMPLGNETDTTMIIKKAYNDGKKTVFPVTDKANGEITPVYADENAVFVKGAFSVNEPWEKNIATPESIDVVIVPGIAFDKNGNRIGFGKGCYDKFLIKTNAVKVGLCYDFQLLDEIPSDLYDIKMDYIITEEGMIEI